MERINMLLKDNEYVQLAKELDEAEKDRRFCLHGLSHSLDVARISYIINLEEQLGYEKDVIYAMALLHDLGRVREYKEGIKHHEAGADIALLILDRCGFSANETGEICDAIKNHKRPALDNDKSLSYILYKADKLSRNCFSCKAYDDCYWSEELKNKGVIS